MPQIEFDTPSAAFHRVSTNKLHALTSDAVPHCNEIACLHPPPMSQYSPKIPSTCFDCPAGSKALDVYSFDYAKPVEHPDPDIPNGKFFVDSNVTAPDGTTGLDLVNFIYAPPVSVMPEILELHTRRLEAGGECAWGHHYAYKYTAGYIAGPHNDATEAFSFAVDDASFNYTTADTQTWGAKWPEEFPNVYLSQGVEGLHTGYGAGLIPGFPGFAVMSAGFPLIDFWYYWDPVQQDVYHNPFESTTWGQRVVTTTYLTTGYDAYLDTRPNREKSGFSMLTNSMEVACGDPISFPNDQEGKFIQVT